MSAAGQVTEEVVVQETALRGAEGRGLSNHGRVTPWLFLTPYLTLFLVFVIAPVVFGAWISLHQYDYTLPGKPFVGLANYVSLFDPSSITFGIFWNSMQATAIFTLLSVPLLLVIPLLVALVMNKSFPGRNALRAVYFAPYVLGVAVVAVLWRYLLDTNIGLVNYYLGRLGLPDDIAWTTSVPAAWVALVGVTVWWTLGFNAVIYLAGLQETSPASSTRRPGWTGPAPCSSSGTSRCPGCDRCSPLSRWSRSSPRSTCSGSPTSSPVGLRVGRRGPRSTRSPKPGSVTTRWAARPR